MASAVVFTGKSGERYRFDVYAIAGKLPAVPGVYVVTRRALDERNFATRGTHRTLAIGEAADVAAAFSGKSEMKTLETHGATSICIRAVLDRPSRARIEQDLIEGNGTARGSLLHLFDRGEARDKPRPSTPVDRES
jgi:hypothetical protein